MPPRKNSRYTSSEIRWDTSNVMFLTEPSLVSWDETLEGVKEHTVSEGERLWDLAFRYFTGIENAEHLWWVIGAFQPIPLVDPTRPLEVGSTIYVPPVSWVRERVLNQ